MEEENERKGCTVFGCISQIIGLILLMIVMTFAKSCGRSMVRNAEKQKYSENVSTSDKEEKTEQIYRVMNQLREELPQELDEVTIQKDVQMDDAYFYYIYDLDDSGTNFASASYTNLKKTQSAALKSIFPRMKLLVKVLIETDRGLVYRYHGTESGATRDIIFSREELMRLMDET